MELRGLRRGLPGNGQGLPVPGHPAELRRRAATTPIRKDERVRFAERPAPADAASSHGLRAPSLERGCRRSLAGSGQLRDRVGIEFEPRGLDEFAELIDARGARDGGRDARPGQQPGEGDLPRRRAVTRRDRVERREDL